MKRTPVESSDVKSIGWDVNCHSCNAALNNSVYTRYNYAVCSQACASSNEIHPNALLQSGTLEVEFHRNGIYTYSNVTEADYNAVVHSESVGKALHAIVKTKGYAYSKVVEIITEK